MTKVFVNGLWAGSIDNPIESIEKIHLFRRNALIPIYTSATFEIKLNTIFIYTDSGRLCRPIFYVNHETNKLSYENPVITEKLKDNFSWNDLITGFNVKKMSVTDQKIYELNELYQGIDVESNPEKLKRFKELQAIVDYIDPSESENALIAVNQDEFKKNNTRYTHLEIHESLLFGVMCNQITFPENNPPTRNAFSCGQSKQSVSMYHTNFQMRMDKTAVVLNSGQIPLVKTRFLDHINREENTYGENTIVAIMCYSGYNMEDSILINEAALKRGLFQTTYYSVYETHEETSKNADTVVDKRLTNIESVNNVIGTKPGYDYSQLDSYGIIRENTQINDKTVLIGMTSNSEINKEVRLDISKTPKKGQLGVVDKSFIAEGEEGERIAKVRVREIRIPNLGDKMASRNGQKGTVGLVVPECDMPFTKDGLRPDLIINPHAIPSRMTIGQLVECIVGKTCAIYGAFGDCTAFINKGSKIGHFGEQLTKAGFHSTGNEILYNGMTGEQLESNIYIGPTYYMRLKHMVKDKINYRARGPMTALTRQPVSGRANDGGLRIGEMERDVLLSHGMNNFLQESMLDRGDKYYMAICNQTGMLAIYNPSKNLFMSPMADGPIRFTGSVDGTSMYIENITKYGRDFSIVCVPYSLKLLLQELQTINIQMRIITEDNIGQLENLSFSKNIEKLMNVKGVTTKDVIREIKESLSKENNIDDKIKNLSLKYPIMEEEIEPSTVESPPPEWSLNEPSSPPFTIENGEEYVPNEIHSPNSPEYSTYPPAYVPPPYNPITGGRHHKEQPEQYFIGEQVYLRGNPHQIWRIKDLGGGEFITIECDYIEGMNEISDCIKVVSPIDIYRPSEIIYNNTTEPYYENQQYHQSPHPQYQQQMPYGGINVNPVIKIVTGTDNSIGGTDSSETGTTIDTQQPQQLQHHHNKNHEKEKKPETPEKIDGGSGNGIIDFSKLVIKKLFN